MNRLKIDDPIEAAQVHGFCGIWGVLALAFFKIDEGIFYGGSNSGKLLGAQVIGILFIIAWTGVFSTLFFLVAKQFKVLRLDEIDEVLGGDIHYFGPIEFTGERYQYDMEEGLERKGLKGNANELNVQINLSPSRKKEAAFSGAERVGGA